MPSLHPRRGVAGWVEVLMAMFAPPNLLSNVCRKIATVRQGGIEHLGESVDFVLVVFSLEY